MSGSKDKFDLAQVFICHRQSMQAVAFRVLKSKEFVDDVLQDAYLKIVSLRTEGVVDNSVGYCVRVVKNTAIDYCRRTSFEAQIISYVSFDNLPEIGDAWSALDELHAKRALEATARVLASFPNRAQLAFELHRLEGLTQREVGKRLGLSATSINFMLKDMSVELHKLQHAWRH